jgi:hypothetical protein
VRDSMEQANALLTEAARLIITDSEYAGDNWATLAIVFNFVDGRKNAYGYIFKADGSWAASLPEENMGPALAKMRELQAAMEGQTGKKWHRALIHINRETTAMNAQFEYDDPTRWQIVPSKLEESVNAVRP